MNSKKTLALSSIFLLGMLEQEYKADVLADYDRKVKESRLSSSLVSPTPAGLKAEAVRACEHRFMPKDEVLLRSFFKQKESPTAYRFAILKDDASVFKPLNNFLRDRSIDTKFKNIELLAWLIDFEPRPFHPGLVRNTLAGMTMEAPPPVSPPARELISPEGFTSPFVDKTVTKGRKRILVFGLMVLTIVVAGFWLLKRSAGHPTGKEGCMIWDNDHYQPVDCHDPTAQSIARKIDHNLVDHFQKILKPDTLTLHSMGKVWYAKYKGRVEFFTAEGYHPLDSNRRLLPMSDYILEKYVYHMSN
jgi:hypothetical protein